MNPVLFLHVPVLHRGYADLLKQFSSSSETLLLMGNSITDQVTDIKKQISRLDPYWMAERLAGCLPEIKVCELTDLKSLQNTRLIMVDDYVSRLVQETYLPNASTEFVSVFLQWDRSNVQTVHAATYASQISRNEFDQKMIALAYEEAKKSSDWWRHVGCVAVREGRVLKASYNRIVPSEHTQYALNDPRTALEAGTQTELSLAVHSEQEIVGWAANNGIALKGCWLYLTTFPCPVCAKLIVLAGVKKIFFEEGWASLDSETILNAFDVEIIRVE